MADLGGGETEPAPKDPEGNGAAAIDDAAAAPVAAVGGGDGGGGEAAAEPAAAEGEEKPPEEEEASPAAAAAEDEPHEEETSPAAEAAEDKPHEEETSPDAAAAAAEDKPVDEETPPAAAAAEDKPLDEETSPAAPAAEEDAPSKEEEEEEEEKPPPPEPVKPKPDPSFVGRKVKKRFGTKFFWGEIVEIITPDAEDEEEKKKEQQEEEVAKKEEGQDEEKADTAKEGEDEAAAAAETKEEAGGDDKMAVEGEESKKAGDEGAAAAAEAPAPKGGGDVEMDDAEKPAAADSAAAAEKTEEEEGGGKEMAVDENKEAGDAADEEKKKQQEQEDAKKDEEKAPAAKEGEDEAAASTEAPAVEGDGDGDVKMDDADKSAEESMEAGDAPEGGAKKEEDAKKGDDKKDGDDVEKKERDDGVFYYRVLYEDGDTEDLEHDEILPLLERAQKELDRAAKVKEREIQRKAREEARKEAERRRLEKKYPDGIPTPSRRSKRSHDSPGDAPAKKRAKTGKKKKRKKKAKAIFPEPDHPYEMVEFKFLSTTSGCTAKIGNGEHKAEEEGSKIGPGGGKKKELVLGYVQIPLVRDDKTGKLSLPPLDEDENAKGGLKVYGTLTRLITGRSKTLGRKSDFAVARRIEDDEKPIHADRVVYEDFVGRIVNHRVWSDETEDYEYGSDGPHLELGYYQDPTNGEHEFVRLPTSHNNFDVRNVACRFLSSSLVPWIEKGGRGSLEFVQRDASVGGFTYTLALETLPSEMSPGPRRGEDEEEEREALYDDKKPDWKKLERLLKKRYDSVWTKEHEFRNRLVEYKRYLALNILEDKDASENDRKRKHYDPSPDVDEVWRVHVSFPELYRRDLSRYASELVEKGGDDDDDENDDLREFVLDRSPCLPEEARARYEATLDAIDSDEVRDAVGGIEICREHWPSPDVVFSSGEGE